jgi:drug/metabolite transporter (DMT)-like permease
MCSGALRQRRFSRRFGCAPLRSDTGDDFFSARRFLYARCSVAVAAAGQSEHRRFALGRSGGRSPGAIGLTLLYQGLALGKMSLVAPVTAVLAVILSGLVGLLSGDRLSLVGLAGITLALAAIILISQDGAAKRPPHYDKTRSSRILPIAVFAGLFIGVFFAALKQSSASSGLLPLASARLTALVALVVVALLRRSALRVGRDVVGLILLGGALDILANMLYVLAARHGMLTIAATLTSLYPASTIILARLVLGERLRTIQIAGLSCAGIGVVLIGTG